MRGVLQGLVLYTIFRDLLVGIEGAFYAVTISALLFFYCSRLRIMIFRPYLRFLGVTVVLVIFGHLLSGSTVGVGIALQGIFFSFIFTFYLFAFYQANLGTDEIVKLTATAVGGIVVMTLFATLKGLVFGFSMSDVESQFALLRGSSFGTENLVMFISTIVIGVVFSLFLFMLTRRRLWLFVALALSIAIVSTFSRKALIVVVFSWAVFFFLSKSVFTRAGKVLIVASFVLLPTFLVPGLGARFTELAVYSPSEVGENVARTAMYITAFRVAVDYFPVGGGFGSFASIPASNHYSELYYKYGLSTVYGLEPNAKELGRDFLLDAFYPQAIGEFGFLFGVLYLAAIFYPFIKVLQLTGRTSKDAFSMPWTSVRFVVICLFALAVIESFGSPLLINPTGLVFIWGFLGIFWRWRRKCAASNLPI